MVPKFEQSRSESVHECLDIGQGAIASSADVDGGEEREDIFGRFGQFPKLGLLALAVS